MYSICLSDSQTFISAIMGNTDCHQRLVINASFNQYSSQFLAPIGALAVLMCVRSVQTFLEQSIFFYLGQRASRILRVLSQASTIGCRLRVAVVGCGDPFVLFQWMPECLRHLVQEFNPPLQPHRII